MLEPAASMVALADGGRPWPLTEPDLVLSVLDGLSLAEPPVLDLAVKGPAGPVAVEMSADGADSLWWSEPRGFVSAIPLLAVASSSHFTVRTQTVRVYGLPAGGAPSEDGPAIGLATSLPDACRVDLAVNVRLDMGPLSGVPGLKSVTFASEGAKFSLKQSMFDGCGVLESVKVGEGDDAVFATWPSIEAYAFRGCSSLTTCPLERPPNNAVDERSLGSECFCGCVSMPGNNGPGTLKLSNGTTLGVGCLAGCSKITVVTHSGIVHRCAYIGQHSSCGLARSYVAPGGASASEDRQETLRVSGYNSRLVYVNHVWNGSGWT